jgi:plasmid maintenance system killer protein
MVRAYGADMARRLGSRLQELEAATVIGDLRTLPQARAHELKRDRDEEISLDLVHPMRLIVSVADDPIPRTAAGGLDWALISRVIVEEIVDTHE